MFERLIALLFFLGEKRVQRNELKDELKRKFLQEINFHFYRNELKDELQTKKKKRKFLHEINVDGFLREEIRESEEEEFESELLTGIQDFFEARENYFPAALEAKMNIHWNDKRLKFIHFIPLNVID